MPNLNLTDDEFIEKYKPIKNPAHDDGDVWYGCVIDANGMEFKRVRAALETNPDTVWTVIETDGEISVTNGFHVVNRMGYLITEVPLKPGIDFVEVTDPDMRLLDDEAGPTIAAANLQMQQF